MGRQSPYLLSAALLLMVWIATPILALVHGVVERHAYCAEHERVEDVVESHGAAAYLASDPPRDGDARSEATRGEDSQHSEGHQDCAFGDSFVREALLCEFDVAVTPAEQTQTLQGDALPAASAPSIALLHIAPKNSPPHFA